jgi:hypothetical protein
MVLAMPRCILLVIFGFVLLSPATIGGQEGKAKTFQEYLHPLRGNPAGLPELLFIGPEAKEFVKAEPDGLRITLPAGFDGERSNHGFNSGMAVHGDFEITVSFEILKEPGPGEAGAKGTKLHLSATLDRPPWDVCGFSRHLRTVIPTKFTAWANRTNEATGKNDAQFKGFDAKSTRWRFRLARTGAVLSYLLAEQDEPDFRLLHQLAWFDEDLKDIRVVASTGGPQAALDVRVTDLRIRAESLPNLPDDERRSGLPADGWRWTAWLTAGVALVFVAGLTLVVRQVRRRGAATDTATLAAVSPTLACPGCGKNMKYTAALAGRKVKCSQCGQVFQCVE